MAGTWTLTEVMGTPPWPECSGEQMVPPFLHMVPPAFRRETRAKR